MISAILRKRWVKMLVLLWRIYLWPRKKTTCHHCDEGGGVCAYPYYGLAPHKSFDTEAHAFQTHYIPQELWPLNFLPEDGITTHGTYLYCPKCGASAAGHNRKHSRIDPVYENHRVEEVWSPAHVVEDKYERLEEIQQGNKGTQLLPKLHAGPKPGR